MVSIGRKLDLLHEGHIINWLHVHAQYIQKLSNLLAPQNAFLLNWDLLIIFHGLSTISKITPNFFCVEM